MGSLIRGSKPLARGALTLAFCGIMATGGAVSTFAQDVEVAEPANAAELAELERLCAAATPGPWFLPDDADPASDGWPLCWMDDYTVCHGHGDGKVTPPEQSLTDLRLIAAAREALPRLLAEAAVILQPQHRPFGIDHIEARTDVHQHLIECGAYDEGPDTRRCRRECGTEIHAVGIAPRNAGAHEGP